MLGKVIDSLRIETHCPKGPPVLEFKFDADSQRLGESESHSSLCRSRSAQFLVPEEKEMHKS